VEVSFLVYLEFLSVGQRDVSFVRDLVYFKIVVCNSKDFFLILWSLISIVLRVVAILLSIAFVTLFERHLLGISQSRLGPNRVSIMGLVQPLLDGIKLLSKEGVIPSSGNILLYIGAPLISFIIMVLEWFTLPPIYPFLSFQ